MHWIGDSVIDQRVPVPVMLRAMVLSNAIVRHWVGFYWPIAPNFLGKMSSPPARSDLCDFGRDIRSPAHSAPIGAQRQPRTFVIFDWPA